MTLDDAVRGLGFADVDEFHQLVSEADVSTPERLAAFERWKANDGSKAGLLKLASGSASLTRTTDVPVPRWKA